MTPSFPLILRSFKLVKVSVIVISGYGSVIFEILLYLYSIGSCKRSSVFSVTVRACVCDRKGGGGGGGGADRVRGERRESMNASLIICHSQ